MLTSQVAQLSDWSLKAPKRKDDGRKGGWQASTTRSSRKAGLCIVSDGMGTIKSVIKPKRAKRGDKPMQDGQVNRI